MMLPANNHEKLGRLILAVSLSSIAALILMVMRVPDWLFNFWPDWIALVLVYWGLSKPERIGPLFGFLVGTILEVLFVRKFGALGFGYATLVFIVNSFNQQLKIIPLWQQTILVAIFISIVKIVVGWLYGIVADFTITAQYFYSMFGNLLLWPFVFILLDEFRRSMRIK